MADRRTGNVLLIDLSSLAHPAYHMNKDDANPNATADKCVARVIELSNGPHFTGICLDVGRSFRREIDERYKANRPERDATLSMQIELIKERLTTEGFAMFGLDGFEADDIIACGVKHFLTQHDVNVVVASSDKDLMQLVGPRVQQKAMTDGTLYGAAEVETKFAVRPDQMLDYLTMVGDNSDNIKGVPGIGPKKAVELLKKYGTLDQVFLAVGSDDSAMPAAIKKSLHEFYMAGTFETVRKLITLRDELPEDSTIAFDQVFNERAKAEPSAPAPSMAMPEEDDDAMPIGTVAPAVNPFAGIEKTHGLGPEQNQFVPDQIQTVMSPSDRRRVIEGEVVEYDQQYEPRSLKGAMALAENLHNSNLFRVNHPNAQAVLTVLITGRELGLSTMASMRGIHIIESKPALSAQLMVALILKSGLAKYWEIEESDATKCTIVTHRKKARKEQRLTHTIEMAQTAGLCKPNSNWIKVPTDMLVARCSSRLARLVYPDLMFGMYTPEELEESRRGGI